MTKILVAILLTFLLTSTVASVNAAEIRVPASETEMLVISETETPKNLYTVGETVTVNASVTGDLVVAGGKVMVSGPVEHSVTAAGGTVTLRGPIGQNARIGGGDVTVSSTINGDLVIGGGTVVLTDQAVVNGDVIIGGGDVTIDGVVKGTVRVGGGIVAINNSVGAVRAKVDSLVLGSKAVINGDLTYTAKETVTLTNGAKVTGQTTFTQFKQTNNSLLGAFTFGSLLMTLGSIILLLVLIRLWPQFSHNVWQRSINGFAPMIGYGALGVFVLPIILIGLMVTIVGLPIAGLILFAWITIVILAVAYAKLVLGAWIVQKLTKSAEAKLDWQAVVVGVLVSGLLFFIPFVGILTNFILFLLVFGVLLTGFFKRNNPEIKTV